MLSGTATTDIQASNHSNNPGPKRTSPARLLHRNRKITNMIALETRFPLHRLITNQLAKTVLDLLGLFLSRQYSRQMGEDESAWLLGEAMKDGVLATLAKDSDTPCRSSQDSRTPSSRRQPLSSASPCFESAPPKGRMGNRMHHHDGFVGCFANLMSRFRTQEGVGRDVLSCSQRSRTRLLSAGHGSSVFAMCCWSLGTCGRGLTWGLPLVVVLEVDASLGIAEFVLLSSGRFCCRWNLQKTFDAR